MRTRKYMTILARKPIINLRLQMLQLRGNLRLANLNIIFQLLIFIIKWRNLSSAYFILNIMKQSTNNVVGGDESLK